MRRVTLQSMREKMLVRCGVGDWDRTIKYQIFPVRIHISHRQDILMTYKARMAATLRRRGCGKRSSFLIVIEYKYMTLCQVLIALLPFLRDKAAGGRAMGAEKRRPGWTGYTV